MDSGPFATRRANGKVALIPAVRGPRSSGKVRPKAVVDLPRLSKIGDDAHHRSINLIGLRSQ
jgi:hypothetical protein